MKYIIEPEKLIEMMNDNMSMVIFDARYSLMDDEYGINAYLEGHIKDAFLIDVRNVLSKKPKEHGGNNPLQDKEVLKSFLESYGISNDTIVVIYDEGDFNGPARMLFQLRNIGLENVYILNGGIEAYKLAGGQIETRVNSNEKIESGHINMKENEIETVDIEYVKKKIEDEDSILIDARARERYLGENEPMYPKAGHIPTAKNYPTGLLFEDGKFKDLSSLKDIFSDLNDKEIILSCGSGISACVDSLALRELGIDHKIYIGSFSDWISYPDNEVSTSEE